MNFLKVILFVSFAGVFFGFSALAGTPEKKDIKDNKDTIPSYKYIFDDPILEMLDSLAVSRYIKCLGYIPDSSVLNTFNYSPDSIPVFPEELFQARMQKLDASSPFPYVYNKDVKAFIDFYAYRKRNLVSRMLGMSKLYFPMIESTLAQYNMPLELKYLAIVESALNPFAVSRVGATGLWQFMYHTGKVYDLNVTTYVDERYDPVKETVAACEFMQDLYNLYGDWALVLAAYNSGPGNVNKAIRRSGGKTNFWDIKQYLPKETQGYVPAFIAVSYIMTHASEFNLFPLEPKITYYKLDTLQIHRPVSFEQIAAVLSINTDDLRFLNPSYKTGYIPYVDQPMTLVLPHHLIGDFMMNQEAIFNYVSPDANKKQEELLTRLNVSKTDKNTDSSTPTVAFHTVRKGQYLSVIASKYNCTTADIKKWNNLKSNSVQVGQRLKIYSSNIDKDYATSATAHATPNKKVVKPVKPVVKDSLASKTPGQKTNDKEQEKTAAKEETVKEKTDKPTPVVTEPAKNNTTAQTAKNQNKKNESNSKFKYHTVQKGDTLWGIANKYKGVTVEEIRKVNKISDTKGLQPGTKIKIPLIG